MTAVPGASVKTWQGQSRPPGLGPNPPVALVSLGVKSFQWDHEAPGLLSLRDLVLFLLCPHFSPSPLTHSLQPLASFLIPRHAQPGMFSLPVTQPQPCCTRISAPMSFPEAFPDSPIPRKQPPLCHLDPLDRKCFSELPLSLASLYPDHFSHCFVLCYITCLSDGLPQLDCKLPRGYIFLFILFTAGTSFVA